MEADVFLRFAESFTDPIYLLSENGHILAANQAAHRFLGVESDALFEQALTAVVEESTETVNAFIRTCSRSRQPAAGNFTWLSQSGSINTICHGNLLQPKSAGKPALILLHCKPKRESTISFHSLNLQLATLQREVKQRRAAEQQLRSSEAHARAVLDTAVDGIISIDSHGIIESINPAAERLFGYQAAEVLGKNIKMLMPEPYQHEHDQYIKNYLGGGEKKIIGIGREVTGKCKDGSAFPMDLSVSEIILDQKRSFTGIVRDISERKQAEEILREREEALTLAFQNAPLGIVTTDLQGRYLSVNQVFCDMLGYSENDLLNMNVTDVTHPDDIEKLTPFVKRIAEGEIDNFVLAKRCLSKSGEIIPSVLHAAAAHDANGNPIRLISQIENRTEQLTMEREVRDQREKLAHVTRVSTMGEMATGIAHEINQPLTAITTYAQACQRLIESGEDETTEIIHGMEQIANQAERAGEVIRRLRSFVKNRESTRELVDINTLARDVVSLSEVDARLHDISIELELEAALPRVDVDPIQIQQVIINLIRNGMDAMLDNDINSSVIKLSTYHGDNDTIHVSVIDQGKGLSQDAQKHVFDPFFTTKQSGMGMGLSICRSIINAHGGKLYYEPNPEGGSIFKFSLPTSIEN